MYLIPTRHFQKTILIYKPAFIPKTRNSYQHKSDIIKRIDMTIKPDFVKVKVFITKKGILESCICDRQRAIEVLCKLLEAKRFWCKIDCILYKNNIRLFERNTLPIV